VAAFASTNLGDVSPNTAGPKCLDTGEPCDLVTSTCHGKSELCVAFGPGNTMEESTEMIGQRQFEMAVQLMERTIRRRMTASKFDNMGMDKKRNTTIDTTTTITTDSPTAEGDFLHGPVQFRHAFVNMANLTVVLDNGDTVRTCPAALGYAFAAGTTDGPGKFDFTQGQNTSNLFWNMIGGFLSPPSQQQKECHHPKPILLNTGEATLPYPWDPKTVPISVFRVGRLFILNVPCEFTTMAGRRLRRAIETIATDHGIDKPEITIAGLANSYTHYVTTFEEYAGQRYEAASTLYGPHTLSGYIQEFERIVLDLLNDRPSLTDAPPQDLRKKQISLIPPVLADTIGVGKKFGSVAIDSKDAYTRGTDTVHVSFRSANPRNNQRIEGTFMTVDHHLEEDGSWKTLYVDGDWCTKYVWKSDVVGLFGISFAEMYWQIPSDATPGTYRICHEGTRKTLIGDVEWLAFYAPDWWLLETFGSMAAGLLAQGIKLLGSLSGSIERWQFGYKDFYGCSSSFVVT